MREPRQPGVRASGVDGLGGRRAIATPRAGAAPQRAYRAGRLFDRCALRHWSRGAGKLGGEALKKQILVLALILGSVLPPATYAKDQSELLSSAQPTIQNIAKTTRPSCLRTVFPRRTFLREKRELTRRLVTKTGKDSSTRSLPPNFQTDSPFQPTCPPSRIPTASPFRRAH